jgi:hypothetical protein
MKFHTTLLCTGKTTTGIPVPDGIVEGLGAGKRPAVRVIVNGYSYRSTIGVVSGKYMIPVSADVRGAAGVAGGDEVDVIVDVDKTPRVLAVPDDLRKALARDPAARKAFEALSNSKKQRYTIPIEKAKAAETRQRNVEKAVRELKQARQA